MRTILLAGLLIASPLHAQVGAVNPGQAERTRADLERLAAFYEESVSSTAYSPAVRESFREELERVRSRLQNGDFRLGDRIVLAVRGEPDLPDTIQVESGPAITLELFGTISLEGVLRSEVEAHITQYLSSFIRDPVVRATGLMRISVQGAVGNPGFYWAPANMLLSEAVMIAGGPGPDADVEDVTVRRGAQVLMDGDDLQEAIREGYTLDQLNLQAGDQIVMGARGTGIFGSLGTIIGVVTSVSLLVVTLAR